MVREAVDGPCCKEGYSADQVDKVLMILRVLTEGQANQLHYNLYQEEEVQQDNQQKGVLIDEVVLDRKTEVGQYYEFEKDTTHEEGLKRWTNYDLPK